MRPSDGESEERKVRALSFFGQSLLQPSSFGIHFSYCSKKSANRHWAGGPRPRWACVFAVHLQVPGLLGAVPDRDEIQRKSLRFPSMFSAVYTSSPPRLSFFETQELDISGLFLL